MLFRTLKKIINNSKPSSPKDEYIRQNDRKKTEIVSPFSPINKISQEITRKRTITEKFSKQIEEKNTYIEQLESEKSDLLNELKQFYIEIIEMLKMDHVIIKNLIKIKQFLLPKRTLIKSSKSSSYQWI